MNCALIESSHFLTLLIASISVSVRIEPGSKPVIIFGQDESVFSQFSFNGKQWVSPDGKRAILPKSNGMGIMISAFQSREFGFGLELTPQQLKAINDYQKLPDHCEYILTRRQLKMSTAL